MQLPDHHHSEDSFSSHGTQPAVDENIEVREGERWVVPISAPNPAPLGSAEHPIVVDDDAESLFENRGQPYGVREGMYRRLPSNFLPPTEEPRHGARPESNTPSGTRGPRPRCMTNELDFIADDSLSDCEEMLEDPSALQECRMNDIRQDLEPYMHYVVRSSLVGTLADPEETAKGLYHMVEAVVKRCGHHWGQDLDPENRVPFPDDRKFMLEVAEAMMRYAQHKDLEKEMMADEEQERRSFL